jgi:hypothetical protein
MRFVADERKVFEQRLDRRFMRRQIVDRSAERREAAAQVDLEDRPAGYAADCRERLQRRTVGVIDARRVERKAVALTHALERTGLAMVQLREAADDGQLDVRFRNYADPVVACDHRIAPSARMLR